MTIKKILIFIVLCLFSISTFADVNVGGYYRKNGTYVQPHHRSDPNSNVNDNWSTKGNTNPYTGKEGTQNPEKNSWGSRY